MASSAGHSLLRPYRGGDDDLEAFLLKFRVVSRIQKWTSEAKRMDHFPLFLDKDAFTVWSALPDVEQTSEEVVHGALRAAFCITPAEAYKKFVARTLRRGESVDVYLADLRRFLRQSGHVEARDTSSGKSSDPVLLEQFLLGIPQVLACQVRLQHALHCMTVDQCADQVRVLVSATQVSAAPVQGVRSATFAATSSSSSGPSKRSVLCYRCNKVGHIQRNCPQLPKSPASGEPVCYGCKERGHVRSACPQRKGCAGAAASEDVGHVCVASEIDGPAVALPRIFLPVKRCDAVAFRRCVAAIDSCSTHTLVSRQLAEDLALEVTTSTPDIITVDGNTLKVLGSAVLDVERVDETVFLPFSSVSVSIVPELSVVNADVLLGLNLISQHGGVDLKYADSKLVGASFGQAASASADVPSSDVRSDDGDSPQLLRHVTVEHDGEDVILTTADGSVRWRADVGYWELTWAWKDEPPMRPVGSGIGEYSRHSLSTDQESQFCEEVDMWIRNGWLVPHDQAVHGEPGAVLPLLAVAQTHKESTPVRPCLDYRQLNKLIVSHPGLDVPVCQEKLRQWRSIGNADSHVLLDISKAYLNIRIAPALAKFQTVVWKGQLFAMERMGFGLSIAPKFMDIIVKWVLRAYADVDNCVDDLYVPKPRLRAVTDQLSQYGLPTKPAEPVVSARVLGLQLSESADGQVRWKRRGDVMPTCQPNAITRREIFKWCGKLTSHYPVGSWLRPACSYLKRLSSLQPGWDDPVSHEVVACCAEVIHRLQTDDPAQGVWSVPEGAQWSLWCDASDIAHGAVIQADGMIVEDGCWLRQKDDRRHINIAELDAVIKGLNLAVQWQVKELTLFTDSKTVAAWLQSVLGNVSRVRVSGLQQVLVQRRLQIITDLVAVTGLTVKVQWISSQQNKADQLTRVPSSWIRCGKTLLARTAPSVTAAVVTVGPFSLDRVSAAQNADPRIVSTRQQVIDGKVVDVELLKRDVGAEVFADVPAADAVADVPTADAVADVPAADAVIDMPAADAVIDVPAADAVVDVPAPGAVPDAGSGFDPRDPNYVPLRAPADDPAPYQFRPYGLRQRGSLAPPQRFR
ncbi:uncharacterized protein LOC135806289 [Sycon ciliatum]|uniref:uncharacterized protein LOC135806289 n=1 Tax=Sycon ciliatum TaxID=27933 RepID=UPI0031F707F1